MAKFAKKIKAEKPKPEYKFGVTFFQRLFRFEFRKLPLMLLIAVIILVILFERCPKPQGPGDRIVEGGGQMIEPIPPRDSAAGSRRTLDAGEYFCGTDIAPGRYKVTPPENGHYGGIIVYEKGTETLPQVNEIIGIHSEFSGVPSVTVTLSEGQKLSIARLYSVVFTPEPTYFRSELTTGEWEVGLDIEEGTYIVTCNDEFRSGYLEVFAGYSMLSSKEGDHSGLAKVVSKDFDNKNGIENTVVVTLKNQYIIRVHGVEGLTFTKY